MPYTQSAYPYRALVQIHAHTTGSDGSLSPAAVVAQYAAAGYDALVLTDHDAVTSQPAGIAIAPQGNELSFASHILSLGCSYVRGSNTDPQANLDAVLLAGGIPVIAHPLWKGTANVADTPIEELRDLNGYAGIELHNAVCLGHATNPVNWPAVAIELWDTLLREQSRSLWGFASDDFHNITNQRGYDIGRLIVFPQSWDVAGILQAIRDGDFVADVSNHGVTLNPPDLTSGIALDCPGASRIRFVTELGVAQETEGDEATYEPHGCEWYVRPEVIGSYTEPFDSAIDQVNRWGVSAGSWAVASGQLQQLTDSDVEQQILLKRHLTGDWRAEVDVTLPAQAQQQQAGLVFNLNHDNGYYLSLRGNSPSNPNTLSLWIKQAGVFTLLEAVPFTPSANTPYRLTWSYDSQRAIFTCGCGSASIVRRDTTMRHGMIGFRTRRKANFDNLVIDGFTSYYQPIPVRAA